MSLASNAAPWFNDDASTTLRRKPVCRKTLRNIKGSIQGIEPQRNYGLTNSPSSSNNSATSVVPISKNTNVQNIMKTMTDFDFSDSDGTGLADFRPPPLPQIARPVISTGSTKEGMSNNVRVTDPGSAEYRASNESSSYDSNNFSGKVEESKSLGMYTNYKSAHDAKRSPDPMFLQNAFGTGSGERMTKYAMTNSSGSSDKLMEKLNHLVYMLEEQKNERTNNVMQEVILFAYIGIFTIFVCDTFVRIGKTLR